MDIIVTQCECGAINVCSDDFSNSMSEETFNKEFPELTDKIEENTFYNCDHCVNHWGIDLCGCGSGEPVGECDGNFEECKNNIPAQMKMEQKPFIGWR